MKSTTLGLRLLALHMTVRSFVIQHVQKELPVMEVVGAQALEGIRLLDYR